MAVEGSELSAYFYVFLTVELPAKLVVIFIVIIVYLTGILHSCDFVALLMHYSFPPSFSFLSDNFLLMLSVTFFSFFSYCYCIL